MPRLIDANELLKKAFGKRGGLIHTSDVNKMPTVDAVPVVRCWKCRHRDDAPVDTVAPAFYFCKELQISVRPYDFCRHGERKDEGKKSI